MKYNAFISYRHGGLDGLVAERLHKLLETYRIPSAIQKKTGRRRIERVFRDRDELPTSSNLSQSINDALENSEFLLLICSPRLLESMWCMREVEVFGKLHGKDKIIALLIDGEPDEAFPPGIRTREIDDGNGGVATIDVEPLAADIRAATWKKSLKLLKDEKLRLLAPVLGCGYDDLRQRHRERKRRRIITAGAAALAVSLAFGSFSTYQYLQINRQMQLKLRNQSYVLSEYAQNAITDGDPETAILLARAALPKNGDRPYVSAAESALADALGVYDLSDGFVPSKTVDLPAAPNLLTLSPDGGYAAAVYPYNVAVFDTETAAVVDTLPTAESTLARAEFMPDGTLLYAGADGLTLYDAAQKKALWTSEPATEFAVAADGNVIAAIYKDGNTAAIYSGSGEKKGEVDFGARTFMYPAEDAFVNPHNSLFALSGDGARLAVSFADGSVSVFDTSSGAETPVLNPSDAERFEGGFDGKYFALSATETSPFRSDFTVIDLAESSIIHSESSGLYTYKVYVNGGIYRALNNNLSAVHPAGSMIAKTSVVTVDAQIAAVQRYGNSFVVSDVGGGYYFTEYSDNSEYSKRGKQYNSSYVCEFLSIGENVALTAGYDSGKVRILKRRDNSAKNLLALCGDVDFRQNEVQAFVGESRILLYSAENFWLYDKSGAEIARGNFPDSGDITDRRHDRESENFAVLYKSALRVYSGETGTLLLEKKVISDVVYTQGGIFYNENGANFVVNIGGAEVSAANINAENIVGMSFDGSYSARLDNKNVSFYNAVGSPIFTVETQGKTEVYFARDDSFAVVFSWHGAPTVYALPSGKKLKNLNKTDTLAEVFETEKYLITRYIRTTDGTYALLLDKKTFEPQAYLPQFVDMPGGNSNTFFVLDENRFLRQGELYTYDELTELSDSILSGKTLTAEQTEIYHAD